MRFAIARQDVSPGESMPAVVMLDASTDSWAGGIEFVEETDQRLGEVMRERQTGRVRFAARDRVPPLLRTISAETGIALIDGPVLAEGRIELLWYLRERSISYAYHRYGNLGARSGEARKEPL